LYCSKQFLSCGPVGCVRLVWRYQVVGLAQGGSFGRNDAHSNLLRERSPAPFVGQPRLRHLWGSTRIKFYRRDGNKRDGLTTRPGDFVSWNRSSGAAAISLAHRLGAKRVILLGFDMRLIGGQKNWHDDHIEKFHKPFYRHLKSFPAIARDARELGIEILNATPGSAIKQFPFVDLEEVL